MPALVYHCIILQALAVFEAKADFTEPLVTQYDLLVGPKLQD
jgi:hypothetical protein